MEIGKREGMDMCVIEDSVAVMVANDLTGALCARHPVPAG